MNDKRTLKTTFAGAIIKQVGLDLIQRGKSSATGTARGREQNTINAKLKQTVMWGDAAQGRIYILSINICHFKLENIQMNESDPMEAAYLT